MVCGFDRSLNYQNTLNIMTHDQKQKIDLAETAKQLSEVCFALANFGLRYPVQELATLQTLDLSWNQLTDLPESIGQLTQLQKLDLSYNQLTSLPDSISKLTQLQTLDLSYNRLTDLPDSISKLTQLQTLNLSGNNITDYSILDLLPKTTIVYR